MAWKQLSKPFYLLSTHPRRTIPENWQNGSTTACDGRVKTDGPTTIRDKRFVAQLKTSSRDSVQRCNRIPFLAAEDIASHGTTPFR
jgi:hypothetical protein